MKNLLVVANMPSVNTRRLAEAVVSGASHEDIGNVSTQLLDPLSAGPEDVNDAHAIIIGTTENFGYMSGLIKDFFERIYYPCLEDRQGLPCAVYVRAGLDGQGTITAVKKILAGLRWREVQPVMLLHGKYQPAFEQRCKELGLTIAAGLDSGIF